MQAKAEEARWFYKETAGKRGPVSMEQLLGLLQSRAIPPDAPVWRHGMEAWAPAATVPDLLAAGFVPAAAVADPRPGERRSRTLALVAFAAWACVIAVAMAPPRKPAAREPESLQERLIVIGRAADLDAMPRVIDAIDDPDAVIASTAVTVAEGLLGVRYSESERSDPRALVGKVHTDWMATQEQMRRRNAGKGKLHP